jgi:hypothetical protein
MFHSFISGYEVARAGLFDGWRASSILNSSLDPEHSIRRQGNKCDLIIGKRACIRIVNDTVSTN